ncbi:MAG: DNA recombination protein RmuC [Rikenellaceae bacterium]
METLLILGLINIVGICVVWLVTGRRNSSIQSEISAAKEEYSLLESRYIVSENAIKEQSNTIVKLQEQLLSRDEKICEQQSKLSALELAEQKSHSALLELNKSNAVLSEQLNSKDEKISELTRSIDELRGSEEKLEQRLKTQFELISNRIIEESRDKVSKFNADNIAALMKPFETEIKDFKVQISTANKEQTRERTELETKIKEMVAISQGMSAEAKNLSEALRGNNKAAGNWGETILENILQNSGLTAGPEGYELQEMLRDADGNPYRNDTGHKMIPDAIVHFPDNRNVIIDSKVSITAYTDYCNAESEEDKKKYIRQHIISIKNHIEELNVKSYESYVDGSLDFVMMFIPNDFAAMVALKEDLKLWQNAYNKKILIISPTNLITSLKIVSDLWSREKQHQNVERILERGKFLYDKCCTFVESFKKVGDSLVAIQKVYDAASVQLGEDSGIIRQAEMLVESGIKSKKILALRSQQAKRIAQEQE